MNLGYSHPVKMDEIDGITIDVPAPTRSSSTASTSRRSASSPPTCEPRDLPNPIRARASSTLPKFVRHKEGKAGGAKK
jgi:large subunit ribosomal protein L6